MSSLSEVRGVRAQERHDWTTQEVLEILTSPLLELLQRARSIHKSYHPSGRIQLASLFSIKTGGCPEDCAYCPQSSHHDVGLSQEPLLPLERVLEAAHRARKIGASRFCMGAAWRQAPKGREFEAVLEMVRAVSSLGLETCVTLGMVDEEQARMLAEAGLKAYNHNLDTSPEFYSSIVSTRTYEDRLRTLDNLRKAGIELCVGGIIGMGESLRDRARLLEVLARLDPHPESVPINALVAVPGTPLAGRPPVEPLEVVRMCAAARILMPSSFIRLSAGRAGMSKEAQILCFLAGANSIFVGEKLLTTANVQVGEDVEMLRELGVETLRELGADEP